MNGAATDDHPRLGHWPIEPARLAEPGVSLAELAAQLGVPVDAESAEDAPLIGWRELNRSANGAVLLGAPVDAAAQGWRVAQVQVDVPDALVHVHPDPLALRPSRAERLRGLELRWPEIMLARTAPDDFVIDIVNAGSALWVPGDDSFLVVGVFTDPGETGFSFGWSGSSERPGTPLGPGEYMRTRLDINAGTWDGLRPGTHDLHAVLAGLGLRTAQPLEVTLTRDQIDRHRQRSPSRAHKPENRRRMYEAEIRRLHATMSISRSLTAVADILATAVTDQDAESRLAALLGGDIESARIIYRSQLQNLCAGNRTDLEQRLQEVTRRHDALDVERAEAQAPLKGSRSSYRSS